MDSDRWELPAIKRRTRLRGSQRALILVTAAACLMSIGGLIGALWVRSPADIAARSQAPPPTVLTATVQKQVVQVTLVTRGTITTGGQVQAAPQVIPGAVRNVVTALDVHVGSKVHDGEVLVGISGQPVFVLIGPLPAWRNLVPGDKGPDVTELQQALAGLGFGLGSDTLGTYGPGTSAGVAAFYRSIGYPPVEAGSATSSGGSRRVQQYEVPADQVLFVPSLPATVAAIAGPVGSIATDPVVTLNIGKPRLLVQLDPSSRASVHAGETVYASDDATGWHANGRVTSVGSVVTPSSSSSGPPSSSSASGSSTAAPYVPVDVRLPSGAPASEVGENVQVAIVTAKTRAAVLAVPEAAIRTDPSGQDYVLRLGPGGHETRVDVKAGLSGGGMVAITAARGSLIAGDKVVTGS